MRRVTSLFFLVLLVLSACIALSQEKSLITIQGNSMHAGLLVLDVVKDGKAYKLTCNEGVLSCSTLKNGKYQIVQLPKNFGLYECQNIRVYSESAADTDQAPIFGEYCLEEK